jgi:hypothetical protein
MLKKLWGMSKLNFIYLFWVKRVARKLPKDNKVARKMSNDTKNTLDKIRKMLRCGECQKNIGQCKKNVG